MILTILLGAPTILGDSDVVQTYIQVLGTLIGFVTLGGVLYTLYMQRKALEEQTNVNNIQNKVALKEITPIISLSADRNGYEPWSGYVKLNVSQASCVVEKYGFVKPSNLFSDNNISLRMTNVTHHIGQHNLMYLKRSPNIVDVAPYEYDPNIELDELKIELVYGDQYGIAKYEAIFLMSNIFAPEPDFKLIYQQPLKERPANQ